MLVLVFTQTSHFSGKKKSFLKKEKIGKKIFTMCIFSLNKSFFVESPAEFSPQKGEKGEGRGRPLH